MSSEKSSSLGIWLTFVGVLANGAIAVWNGYVANGIKAKQIEIEEFQSKNQASLNLVASELSKKDQDLSRLKFVKDILPDALSGDEKRSATFLTLVQLTLTDNEYKNLLSALSSSTDENLKSVGDQGVVSLRDSQEKNAREIIQLVTAIRSDEKATRLDAMDTIYRDYINETKLITELVEYLGSGKDTPLHIQGRINALFALRATPNNIWTPVLIDNAKLALDAMEAGAESVGPELGSQTNQVRLEVRAKLALLSKTE